MNERIRELALEAGLYYHPHGTCCMDEMFPFHFNPAEADKAYGKFAELIIKECAQVSLKNSHRNDDMGAIIARQISKHFGVAE